ncbi:MAG: acetyl-CoA carboxylase biotin carboxyl carrier protein subunit [Pelagibacteraceae bacterium BACL5 MAG-120705-bin12]|jgi:acetyl-CoA carboxylase biotin carboxyl carrier protein|uniref:acetyl-CoA carboxylase biotin carboxyl carrier protein n=1 Tax=Candidatus Pelagibacter sp. TaxID=2024849 RepID=UPI0007163107|nr:MAG: acetyl-CoA carboxylase biotin carboxyl carrier protein subunit [Pelagibacteraceae bacterium BACL5 MAG-121015-bin10]KRO60925.1 MAG: acetyl-CoA carboxylase biotin carboxyl carrier protein subunit [Pelagibacteraceae bacterium BACL5 MAG-121128-bin54]KRO61058.1 MAG: acetyl-CoA carboxylase biotin carboxyl carrier protein subunit [Pelagibacteraceae bacterium BACL5 MAG-120705-bin12]KRO65308.1 MAG: acetyl-CoA carboxylase biotin carboxyl carrier protein subunit [Pelagibacteraceae bacterium BACL5 M
MKIDKKTIEELSNYLDEFGLTEIEYTDKDTKIKVSKNSISVNQQPINLSTPQSNNTIGDTGKTQNLKTGIEVTSPIIGTAYHSPEPGAKKFVEIGKKIKKGDTIMIVEAMKTMNHVPSTADGIVKEICVEDGQPVEYGQTIIILE